MSTRWQAVLSAAVVLMAGGTVGAYVFFGEGGPGPQEMEGHVHGAGPAAGDELRPVHLDPDRERRIGVTYAVAELKEVERTVRTVATVTYDETRVAYVSPRVHGWVERIHADFLGARVLRGDALVELYGPELVAAQEELLLAHGLLESTREDPESRAYRNAVRLLESARQRLELWDIPPDQVALVEETGRARRSLVLRSPVSGVVVEKNVFDGAHVGAGSTLYAIADLSRVWAEGEVFEKDLSLVELGQAAHIRIEAFPGEMFQGRVSYIYPTVSAAARTGRIRVELDNRDGRLRPGMYAEVQVDVPASGLRVVVPRTAVLMSGERNVAFVRSPDGMLVPREVTLGLSAGREVEILAGIEPGEVVVSSAGFLIDAESNLGAAMGLLHDMEGDMGADPAPAATPQEGHEHDGHGGPGDDRSGARSPMQPNPGR